MNAPATILLSALPWVAGWAVHARVLHGRLGGDEFAAVLIDRDGTAADRFAVLARVLARPVDTAPDVHTTVSLGWVRRADHPAEDLSGLLRRADEAMYAAKRGPARVRRAALGRLLATVAGRRAGRRGAA
ncbi:diguanylate cyclase [Streptomyces olivaceus]|nr:diguanylate cyclase [Streptomyces olivaceus]